MNGIRLSLHKFFLMKKWFLGMLIIGVTSCTSSHDEMKKDVSVSLAKANQTFFTNHPDTVLVNQAGTNIGLFVKKYPQDSLTPIFLFELALLLEKQQNYEKALKTLQDIYTSYPASMAASKAVFFEGFLYANVLRQLDKAKKTYQYYLDNYSAVDSKVTHDVQLELQNLGKSPEEILKGFEEKAKVDTLAPS